MLRSFLLGLVAGSRSMTPIAAVGDAARDGLLPRGAAADFLAHPLVAGGLKLLAAGELAGDKLPSAPDRIVPAGMMARVLSSALAGAAVAPAGQRGGSAALAVAGALVSSYLTFDARIAAMRRHGQTTTGLVEDALVLAATRWIMRGVRAGR